MYIVSDVCKHNVDCGSLVRLEHVFWMTVSTIPIVFPVIGVSPKFLFPANLA